MSSEREEDGLIRCFRKNISPMKTGDFENYFDYAIDLCDFVVYE